MTIDIRQVSHPEAVKGFDTAELRRHFLIETLFVAGEGQADLRHLDRVIVGGAMPTGSRWCCRRRRRSAPMPSWRRELGIVNVGGPGKVLVGGKDYALAKRDALYIGKEAGEVSFASDDAANPAKFYLLSTPAHAVHPTRVIREADAKTLALGEQATANKRVIRQYIIPGVCETCQLVMGVTTLEEAASGTPCRRMSMTGAARSISVRRPR
jgi:4-deoxy-L-threo-5-hexosulose-uronate ketol-isomerase